MEQKKITPSDFVKINISQEDVLDCITRATKITASIQDRTDLHGRGTLERFENVLMGEISEQGLINYLRDSGKLVEPMPDEIKLGGKPDKGYDLVVTLQSGKRVPVSSKCSISYYKQSTEKIFEQNFRIGTKKSEVMPINIMGYFWYDTTNHVNVLSEKNYVICGWLPRRMLLEKGFDTFKGEERVMSKATLQDLRPMNELLPYLA